MKHVASTFLILALTGCDAHQPRRADGPSAGVDPELAGEPTFSFNAPAGFEWSDEHGFFANRSLRASITVSHSQSQDFQAVAEDFTSERMLNANLELLEKEMLEVDGRPTLLVKANRMNVPYPQKTLTSAFATKTGTAQITAVYPASIDPDAESELEAAVTNAQYNEP